MTELYFFLPFVLIIVFMFGFNVGSFSKSYPNEEEMLRRLKRLRAERRIQEEVNQDLDRELNPQGPPPQTPPPKPAK